MNDIKKQCVECGEEFTLTANERNFFQQKSLVEPKRCTPCRLRRKIAKQPLNGGLHHPMGGEHQETV